MAKPKVLIVGKLPPPYYGPAIATKIILESGLKDQFQLLHLDTTVNKSVADFGSLSAKKIGKNLAIYFKLIELLIKHKPDICLIPISQSVPGFIKDSLLILVNVLFGTKIILHLRGSNFRNIIDQTNPLAREYITFCLKRTDAMIVLGTKLRYLFEGIYKPENIFVTPNGCDIQIPSHINQSEKVNLLYFANFHKAKGIGEVIQAIRVLKEEGVSNLQLQAVGAWSDLEFEKDCKKLVDTESLPIVFQKPLSGEEKWKMFARAEVFLFPPNKPEGHPWVIVEAMAAGLPIISTDQGAITESVLEGKNGYIVEVNNPEQLADKLILLLNNKELRKEMGDASKRHYQMNFTEKSMVTNLSKVFNQVNDKAK